MGAKFSTARLGPVSIKYHRHQRKVATNSTFTNASPALRTTSYCQTEDLSKSAPMPSLPVETKTVKYLSRAQLAKTNYVWPINDEEEARYMITHNLWKDIFKGNTLTPTEILERGARVLFIGRDKFWALDMAKTYPASEIHCIDYLGCEGAIFRNQIIPSNCILHKVETGSPLPWPNNYFDLTASRGLMFVLTEADWDRHMNEMVRVTKAGGYVEHFCSSVHVFNGGPVVELIVTSSSYALRANGHNLECYKAVHTFMTKCPRLDPIISQKLAIPLGPWHEESEWRKHGKVMLQQFMIDCRSGLNYSSQALGVPRAKLKLDLEAMQEEFKRYRSYQNVYVEVGRKI